MIPVDIRPHIATNMLFITIWTFTYFPLIHAMTGGGPGRQTQVLAIFMYEQSFKIGKIGYGSAISVGDACGGRPALHLLCPHAEGAQVMERNLPRAAWRWP